MVFNNKDGNNNQNKHEDVEAEFIPAMSKKQKRKIKLQAQSAEYNNQVANIATSASKVVSKRTNSFGGFAAFLGVHAIDFLMGPDSAGSKKKKSKKKKNKGQKR